MSKIMFSYFKSYSGRLTKLQFDETASRDDLLGSEDSQSKSFFFKPSLKNKATVFSVGVRDEVLTSELEAPIIVPHAGQKSEQKYPYEMLFRSLLYALVDNACREFLFISEFFMLDSNTAQVRSLLKMSCNQFIDLYTVSIFSVGVKKPVFTF